jgi:hypothetical protein
MMTMNNAKEQYVYIMSNPSFVDDVFKIGWTREHPIIRANDLHTSGVPTPFVVESVIITTEGGKLEKQLHAHLKQYRIENNREFFKIAKDNLTEILTDELNLQLTSVTELDPPNNKRTTGAANKISEMYETLKKDYNDFSNPMKVANTEFVINNTNVSIRVTEDNGYNSNCLSFARGREDGNERHLKHIRNKCYFIERDIKLYAEQVDNILHNYQEIKERIGDKDMRESNKVLKKWISDTHKDLHELKNKYVWDV